MNPPSCNLQLSAQEIASRLKLADALGVKEVDVFSDVEPPHDPWNASRVPVRSSMPWWTALRAWKRAPAADKDATIFPTPQPRPVPPAAASQLPPGLRFIAAANDSHCIPAEPGAIFLEVMANRTRLHVSSCETCGLPTASGPCCNISRVPCAYVAALRDGGQLKCADIHPPSKSDDGSQRHVRRRVMAWMALTSNLTDNKRQIDEAKLRAEAGNLTDVSPTFFGTGANGSLSGPDPKLCGGRTCAALVRELQAAGLRVHPLVAGWGAGPRGGIADATMYPETFAANAVRVFGPSGLNASGINIDFEATGANLCAVPGNCLQETRAYYRFLEVLSKAMHGAGMQVQVDWATFMGVSNFGSLEGLRDTDIDLICTMDPYGKVGTAFDWITQLELAATCTGLGKGGGAVDSTFNGTNSDVCAKLVACPTAGVCSGVSKLSVGLWPLETCASGAAAQGHSGCSDNGQGPRMTERDVQGIGESLLARGAAHVSVWDAFGSVPRHSLDEMWWVMLGRFLRGG